MNFDFSDDQKQLRDEARKFLAEKCPPKAVRAVLDGKAPYDKELWKGLAEMGFLGVAIPEEFGGAGAGHLELCVIAEEMGRALAPVPFSSTVYLAAEAHAARRQRRAEEEVAAEASRRARRSARWRCSKARAIRRPKAIKLAGLRRHAQRHQEAGARRRHRRFRRSSPRAPARPAATATSRCSSSTSTAGGVDAQVADQPSIRRAARPRSPSRACKAEPLGAAGEGWSILTPGARPRRGADGVRAGRRRRPRAGNGPRLRARPHRLRPPDRLVPGDQAHARRHVCLGDAGALELLLRRLGALDQRRRNCRKPPPPRASARRRRSSIAPRTTSRSMAAWASPGSSTATCTTAAPTRLALGARQRCPIGKTS